MKKKNFSEWAVALIVVICSVILFLALAFALTGTILGKPARTLRANFHDVIGINISANVKYAGALVGNVIGIRMLTIEERIASGDPRNAVQLLLTLNKDVPELPNDITVSVSADTILSDKLILIDGGTATAPLLPADAIVQGVTPVSFDRLVRNVDGAVDGLNGLLSGSSATTGDLFDRLRDLLTKVEALVTQAQPVVQTAGTLLKDAEPVMANAGVFVKDARQLIEENKVPITQAVGTLNRVAGSLDQFAARSVKILNNHEKNINTTLGDFRVTMENLKVTSTYTRFLTRRLLIRPQQLLWGNVRPPTLPSEQEILNSSKPFDLQQ